MLLNKNSLLNYLLQLSISISHIQLTVYVKRAFTISILAVRVGLKDGLPDMDPDLLDRVIDAGHPVQRSCPHILESDQDTLKLSSDEFRILIKIIDWTVKWPILSKKLKTNIRYEHFFRAKICLWVLKLPYKCVKKACFPGTKQFLRTLTKPID